MFVCLCVQHVYVAQTGLTRRLALELLDKMNNPDNHQSHFNQGDEDDLEVMDTTPVCMRESGYAGLLMYV